MEPDRYDNEIGSPMVAEPEEPKPSKGKKLTDEERKAQTMAIVKAKYRNMNKRELEEKVNNMIEKQKQDEELI